MKKSTKKVLVKVLAIVMCLLMVGSTVATILVALF